MTAGTTTGAATRRTITAFYDSRSDAEQAVERVAAAGVARDRIRLIPGNERGGSTTSSTTQGTGTQGTGTQGTGLWESLKDLFLPDEDRHAYAEGLNRGGYLVTVSATDAEYDRALDILDDEGTIDMNEREASWRSQGWNAYASGTGAGSGTGAASEIGSTAIGAAASTTTGVSSSSSTTGATSTAATGSTAATDITGLGVSGERSAAATSGGATSGRETSGREEVIPIVQEQLAVGKRDVSHGRVRVRSYVAETPVTEQVNLREEHVTVDRRPADLPVAAANDPFRERTIDVEERAEEAVVAKEARVTEELVVRKDVQQRTETVSDTVRHTEVEVEDERGNTVRSGDRTAR